MKLTKTTVDLFKYTKSNGKRDIVWDQELSGFGVRIYPSGKKSYVLSYMSNGRKRLMAVGSCKLLTPSQARIRAQRALLEVLDGKDPLQQKQKSKEGGLVKDLCQKFLSQHSMIFKKTWKEDRRRLSVYVIPKLGNFKIISITRADIATLHHEIGKKSIYDANRTLTLLGTIFRFATEWGLLEHHHPNPARGIRKFKELSRDRWVSHEEMPRIAISIDQEDNPFVRAAIWLYLLTGLRKSELLNLKWEQIDFANKVACVAETKNGGKHYLPLSEPSIAILHNLDREMNNPYIIQGKVHGRPLVNISKPWARIRNRAAVKDVRLHDLRRTTGSWLAQKGNSLHLIARVLNHRSQNTTKIYARFAQDQVRDVLESHGKEVGSFMTSGFIRSSKT